jgi:hypothetical protein
MTCSGLDWWVSLCGHRNMFRKKLELSTSANNHYTNLKNKNKRRKRRRRKPYFIVEIRNDIVEFVLGMRRVKV